MHPGFEPNDNAKPAVRRDERGDDGEGVDSVWRREVGVLKTLTGVVTAGCSHSGKSIVGAVIVDRVGSCGLRLLIVVVDCGCGRRGGCGGGGAVVL